MTISRHHVSLRTYTLAFAVALTPALMQTASDCGGSYTLSELQVFVDGQDQIVGFDPAVRSYAIRVTSEADTALVRAFSASLSAEVWLDVENDSSGPTTTPALVGGGEFTIALEPGDATVTVNVKSGGLASFYTVGIGRGLVFSCTEQGILDAIAEGGGPHYFACDGPTIVVTTDAIVIDNDVILDGEGNLTVDGNLAHRVFSVPEGVIAELRWFTIARGRLESGWGGGVLNSGTLTLTNSTVSRNFDGGIFNNGTLTLTNSAVSESSDRPGIRSEGGSVTLTNSTVSGNHSGGIGNLGSMTLTNSTVSGNSAGGIGNGGTLTLTNSTVSDNHGTCGLGCSAPGIANGGTATLTNSTVSGNWGGGIQNEGTMTLTNSTVSDNFGPGLYNLATLALTNSTVSGNDGNGIQNVGSMTLTNSTVSVGGNFSYAIINRWDAPETLIATNSVVDGICTSGITSLGYNIESPGDTCLLDQATDLINVADVGLGPLQDNGGPTMTHALLPGSVAIDQIPEGDCVDADGAPLTTDQRGEPRPETGGTLCDIGAFELQQ